MSPTSFFRRHPRADLSAYLDGELAATAIERLETHLASCAACTAHLAELRETRAVMRSLPEVQAPRSFALTPEIVREAPPVTPVRRIQPLVNSLRLTSVGLAVALAAVLIVDVSGGGGSSSSPTAINLLRGQDSSSEYSAALPSASIVQTDSNLPNVRPTASVVDKGPGATSTSGENLGGTAGGSGGDGGVSAGVGGPPADAGATSVPVPSFAPGAVTTPVSSPMDITSDNTFQDRDDTTGSALATESPKAVAGNIGSATAAPEAQALTSTGDESGGTDTLTIVAIVLGALLAAALIGSIAASRLAREAP